MDKALHQPEPPARHLRLLRQLLHLLQEAGHVLLRPNDSEVGRRPRFNCRIPKIAFGKVCTTDALCRFLSLGNH